MSKLLINENSKVYVLCPAYIKTGGPELLHQLVYELNKNKIDAYVTYFGINKKKNENYTNDDFKKYVKEFKTLNDIEDIENNIVISPEVTSAIKLTKKIKKAQKILWWLSVDNFEKMHGLKNTFNNYGIITTSILMLKGELEYNFSYIKSFDYHLCQSYYSIDYLKNNEINDVIYLSDYVSDEYLSIDENWPDKMDIIVYNPKKGQEFTKNLIEKATNLKFIPIQNLTTLQVKELLLKSKVYIDFGNHPGKDRIPREAAMCGCCIITNKKGSAKYYKDVPINDEFKFDNEDNINCIIEKITQCIEEYDAEIIKFKDYRDFIKNEKSEFSSDLKKFFLE